MSSEDKGRLARWAQRKAAARQRRGAAAPAIAEEPAAVPATAGAPAEESKTEPGEAGQPAPELDLPDVESLTAGSDFTAFMKDGVPAELRRLALRDAAMVVEGMKSAWEAGRGYATKSVEEDGDDKPVSDDPKEQEPVTDEQVASDESPPEDENKQAG
jgi:hypothetical protein